MRRVLACLTVVISMGALLGTVPAQASVIRTPEQWLADNFFLSVSVEAADVDGDKDNDLVTFNTRNVGSWVMESTRSSFMSQTNWGNGDFLDTGFNGDANLAGDFDGDSREDVAAVRLRQPWGIWVARSGVNELGVNHFEKPTNWLANTIVGDNGTWADDLDGDGDDDVVGSFSHIILAALSQGPGNPPLQVWAPEQRKGEKATLVDDVNGDGKADLILVDVKGTRVITANPRWFDEPVSWSDKSIVGTKKTMTGDVDGDGDGDIIAVDDTGVRVMRATGTGFSDPEVWYDGAFFGTRGTVAGDVDGDGDDDLVAVNFNTVWVLRS